MKFYDKYVPEFLKKKHPLVTILGEVSELRRRFLIDIDGCLSSLKDDPFLSSKVKASRNPPDFFSIVSELKAAAHYKNKGREIELLPIKPGAGGDFKMPFREKEIFFEVKRLIEPEKIEDRIMEEIRKIPSPLIVSINYDPWLGDQMAQTIIDETRAEIEASVSQKGGFPIKKVLPYAEIQIDKKDRSNLSKETEVIMIQRMAVKIPFGPIKWKTGKLLEEARQGLSPNDPNVLVIDIHRLFVDIDDVERALYGDKVVNLFLHEASQKVQKADERDPETVSDHGLISKKINPKEDGLFFEDENNVINAVIALDIGAMRKKEIFVNPFVEENRFMGGLKRFLE